MLIEKKEKTPLNKKYDAISAQELYRTSNLTRQYVMVANESNRLMSELARFNKHPMDEIRKLFLKKEEM